jgi:hypothetical protein
MGTGIKFRWRREELLLMITDRSLVRIQPGPYGPVAQLAER